jgi:hypothetical protein
MGSSGKRKTTQAKFARENRLRERRLTKEAKRDARKRVSSDRPDVSGSAPESGSTWSTSPDVRDPNDPASAPVPADPAGQGSSASAVVSGTPR